MQIRDTRGVRRYGAICLSLVLSAIGALAGGCSQGYASARDLESNERGPTECAASCNELGLEMGAFVLMDHAHSGCVCTPRPSPVSSGGDVVHQAASGGVAGAAAYLAAEDARRQQQQQQRRQQQYQQ